MSLSDNTVLISGSQRKNALDTGTGLSELRARLSHLGTYWSERRTHARQMRELYRFSDRELWDVGLNRSDIMLIGKGIYRRDR